ncbi:MAG: LicD family protein [Bacteroidales bacterium]|nr:LicD family protein [Bacteroidales bacterium]
MKIDNRRETNKQNKAFIKYGVEALREAVAATDECGGKLFLAFGTLLGAYRENGFIPFDYDLDTGLLAVERTDELITAMRRHGFKHLRQYYIKSSNRICEDKYDYRGVHLDVHYFYPTSDGNIYCDLCLPHESKPWRKANATDGFPSIIRTVPESTFSKQDFLNVQVFQPDRTVDWLKTLYGEHFMTPDPKWTMRDHKKRSQSNGERMYRRVLD